MKTSRNMLVAVALVGIAIVAVIFCLNLTQSRNKQFFRLNGKSVSAIEFYSVIEKNRLISYKYPHFSAFIGPKNETILFASTNPNTQAYGGDGWFIEIDNEKFGPFSSSPEYSLYGNNKGFVVTTKTWNQNLNQYEKWLFINNKNKLGPFYTHEPTRVYYVSGKPAVVIGKKEEDGKGGLFVLHGEAYRGPYTFVGALHEVGGELTYKAEINREDWYVVQGNNRFGPHDEVFATYHDNDAIADIEGRAVFLALSKYKTYIVDNGRNIPLNFRGSIDSESIVTGKDKLIFYVYCVSSESSCGDYIYDQNGLHKSMDR